MDCDVAIVGAGPAGCAAAFDLARRRVAVLLVDRHLFPRFKACGGGLTAKTLKALRYSVRPVIERTFSNLRISDHHHFERILPSRYPICAMTDRAKFDDYCLQQTMNAGVRFTRIDRLTSIRDGEEFVEIETDAGVIRSRFLIGADGADSRVRHLSGHTEPRHRALAIEAQIPWRGNPIEMTFDFNVVAGGYGWIFPKSDHLNVGLYTCLPTTRITPEDVSAYTQRRLGIAATHAKGHRIGIGGWEYQPASRRILLAGDAAGMADPLLGEGIAYAIRTGQAAAAAIADDLAGRSAARKNYRRLLRPIQRDLSSLWSAARRFHAHPSRGYALLTSPYVRKVLMRGFARGASFRAMKWAGWWQFLQPAPEWDSLPGISGPILPNV
jgi:geranylgeranyl reductase family protein